jgi:hypothetical protein
VDLVDIELHLEADLLVRVREFDDEAVQPEQPIEQQVVIAHNSDRRRRVLSTLRQVRDYGERGRRSGAVGGGGGVTFDLGEEMFDSAELSETAWAPPCLTTTEMEVCMSLTAERLWQLRQVPNVTMTCLREMMRENFVRELSIASLPTCGGWSEAGHGMGGGQNEPRACGWNGLPREGL